MDDKTKKSAFNTENFDTVSLKLASPDVILDWSFGEITKPETINYRTQRAEKNGLFDEKIFGPEKDYECYCGKYRGIRYRGIVCERCGVEITRSVVRRERMGHIELSTPVSHIWFLRSIPSRISLILGISASDVEKVIYFAGYIVTKVVDAEKSRILKELDVEYKTKSKAANDEKTKTKLKELFVTAKQEIESIEEGVVLDEIVYHKYAIKYGTLFETGIGAEAIYDIFKKLDLKKLISKLEERLTKAGSVEREKLNKRLSLIKAMFSADIRPEWMFMVRIPVIPPALRPMVALEGGRHATSDVNDLYRRVINRNNRLKKLKDINAPDVILRNEKRILQEAVDALLDNSIRHGNTLFSAMSQSQRRPLKSLSDYLRGKQGYFRQNLLGKRVDYSARSVIVIGADLKLDECGLPKHMALELFRPFVISKLLERELAYNIRGAGRLIDEGIPEVWAILEEVIKDKYVLLNRAPTLHRQGIQGFRPILIEGNAIQIHPLVCPAFNADFDGDMMAVHLPLSKEAQTEARNIISANKNILKPGNGDPVISSTLLDIVLGCYWMTKIIPGYKGEGKIFATPNDAITAYDFGDIGFRAKIKVMPSDRPRYAKFEGKPFETSVGRIFFNNTLPNDYPYIDYEITKKSMMALVEDLIKVYGLGEIPKIIDKIKRFGFKYATYSGITWGIDDVIVPEGKKEVIEKAKNKSKEILEQYNDGLLSKDEKRRMNIETWIGAKNDIESQIPDTLEKDGSVYDMWKAGARGSIGQFTQMSGMVGLMQNTKGETIEFPITTSIKEGLTPIEYFITTHGSRKGLADTALQTAKAGYLTRRLFDVAQDAIVTEKDCGVKTGVTINKISASGLEISIARNIKGRLLAEDVKDTKGNVMFKKGTFLNAEEAKEIEDAGIESVIVRSPMVCKTQQGICQNCYGMDMTTNNLIEIGEAVGTVAAQAIGEPGTQLTMRTFHTGGTASVGGDITQGLPRVEEVFEKRSPKNPAIIAHVDGTISEIKNDGKEKIIILLPNAGDKAAKSKKNTEYSVHFRRMTLVKLGDKVLKGDFLTDGSANIEELFKYAGKERAQDYIISEINRIYELQGASISRKHIEVIIKQMFSRRKVKESSDENITPGDVIDNFEFKEAVERAKENNKTTPSADPLVLGISEVSLSRKSFLSAASFQNTTKILINAAVRGRQDKLIGLKENVIIGRLIPAGTGFEGSAKAKMVAKKKEEGEDSEEE
ncbi:MAG: DNA-directed RNA polymerase subunit beta' [Candidatus Pacebacteria bacterium]|jgi:DNA-directed RNA polymerase subunit beta'|nr:DNA-directed RNA polymerase subunit beta' [Candidatus Paceibacterota bacterium]MDP7648170.1 DNA-directed RNA polymerase subunit beta' [Candidatus Paceibacterota bacterium]|tara:strand:+ start:3009 stop:6686 length:3678 start_codon:yes stop_codon:yes gene_type:complete